MAYRLPVEMKDSLRQMFDASDTDRSGFIMEMQLKAMIDSGCYAYDEAVQEAMAALRDSWCGTLRTRHPMPCLALPLTTPLVWSGGGAAMTCLPHAHTCSPAGSLQTSMATARSPSMRCAQSLRMRSRTSSPSKSRLAACYRRAGSRARNRTARFVVEPVTRLLVGRASRDWESIVM